jgi:hypothetical protein
MKIVRKISFEGTEEQLVRQLVNSAPDGKHRLPNKLTIVVETIELPDSAKLFKAIQSVPQQWPMHYKVSEGDEK